MRTQVGGVSLPRIYENVRGEVGRRIAANYDRTESRMFRENN